jgi:hypothetical protein
MGSVELNVFGRVGNINTCSIGRQCYTEHFHKCSSAQTELGGAGIRAALAEVGRAALAVAVPCPTHHFRSIPRLENARKDKIR